MCTQDLANLTMNTIATCLSRLPAGRSQRQVEQMVFEAASRPPYPFHRRITVKAEAKRVIVGLQLRAEHHTLISDYYACSPVMSSLIA